MGDLLRALGVARAVLRLVGRHRVASAVAVIVALGWFFHGIGPAGAVTQLRTVHDSRTGVYTGPVSVYRTDPGADRD